MIIELVVLIDSIPTPNERLLACTLLNMLCFIRLRILQWKKEEHLTKCSEFTKWMSSLPDTVTGRSVALLFVFVFWQCCTAVWCCMHRERRARKWTRTRRCPFISRLARVDHCRYGQIWELYTIQASIRGLERTFSFTRFYRMFAARWLSSSRVSRGEN